MPELLRSKKVRARKPHSCATCWGRAIEPGDEYQRDTYVFDGRIYDWVQCVLCAQISRTVFAWAIDAYDGIGQSEYTEWAQDHVDSPEHGPTARLYLNRLHAALTEMTHPTDPGVSDV